MERSWDIVFWPVVFITGIIGAIVRTAYWGAIVTPVVLIASLLVGVGSIPKPIIPILTSLGGRDLHRALGKIVGEK